MALSSCLENYSLSQNRHDGQTWRLQPRATRQEALRLSVWQARAQKAGGGESHPRRAPPSLCTCPGPITAGTAATAIPTRVVRDPESSVTEAASRLPARCTPAHRYGNSVRLASKQGAGSARGTRPTPPPLVPKVRGWESFPESLGETQLPRLLLRAKTKPPRRSSPDGTPERGLRGTGAHSGPSACRG